MNATATIAPTGPQRAPTDAHQHAPTAPPQLRAPQHLRALERANQVRLARAELKRRVAGGEIGVAEVILQCPWEADSMAVADLLMSQRRWGHTRCRKFLSQIPMSEQKTIGSMTERQRHTLAAMLPAAAPAPVTSAMRTRAWPCSDAATGSRMTA